MNAGGPLMRYLTVQHAYVAQDLDESIRHWIEVVASCQPRIWPRMWGASNRARGARGVTRVLL